MRKICLTYWIHITWQAVSTTPTPVAGGPTASASSPASEAGGPTTSTIAKGN